MAAPAVNNTTAHTKKLQNKQNNNDNVINKKTKIIKKVLNKQKQ